MAFLSLRDFIGELEKQGDVVRITAPVATHLEITEIHKRVLHKNGPVLVFENPVLPDGTTSDIPVVVNLFGTKNRIAQALGRPADRLGELGELLAFFRQPEPPQSLAEATKMAPLAKKVWAMLPKTVDKAPCQDIVLQGDDIDLSALPVQGCWPGEPAPLITWPVVVTEGPSAAKQANETGKNPADDANLGIYRMQVLDKNRAIMRWLKHRGGAQHFARWCKTRNEPMPACVVIGTDPATLLAAVTPVPDTLSEYRFAGLLRGTKTELVKAKTVSLMVPANAEIVIEGHVHHEQTAPEGPYGDHTGYYNEVGEYPVFTASAITMRKKPVYLSTYTGRPPDEPSVLAETLNELFVPLLRQQFPEIVDFYLPPAACSYRMAIVSIKKAYAGHARRVMLGIWSFLRQMTYTKYIIVTDDDIDIRNWDDVVWAMTTRADPATDSMIIDRTPVDVLDFASPIPGLGGKMGIDATTKTGTETTRQWGKVLDMDDETKEKITQNWETYGLGF